MQPLAYVLLLAGVLAAQAADDSTPPAECFVKGIEGAFSYDPTTGKGPMDWGSLEGFGLCGTGRAQSPIDFPERVSYAPLADGPKPDIMVADMDLSSSASNWALSCPEGADCGQTVFAGKTFKLINLHFHAPSEHTLAGKRFAMEAHMVHQSDDGSLAVIATMFDAVDEDSYQYKVFAGGKMEFGGSPLVAAILRNLKRNRNSFPVFMGSVIDGNKGYCVYVGSLTTPPCSEGVTFLMANNVETITKRQVSEYLISSGATFVDGNNRPVQDINGRDVTCYILKD